MIIAKSISMDIVQKGVTPVVDVVQGDKYSRAIGISIYKAGSAWYIPENANVTIGYIKPDGTRGLYDKLPDGTSAYSVHLNVVTVKLAPQMLTVPGTVKSTVIISIGEHEIGTFPIAINVAPNSAFGAVGSEDYYYSSVIGNLDDLKTEEKDNIVAAINEVLRRGADMEEIQMIVDEYLNSYDFGGGTHVGPEAPEDPNVDIWVDTDEEGSVFGCGIHVGAEQPDDSSVSFWLDTDEESVDAPQGGGGSANPKLVKSITITEDVTAVTESLADLTLTNYRIHLFMPNTPDATATSGNSFRMYLVVGGNKRWVMYNLGRNYGHATDAIFEVLQCSDNKQFTKMVQTREAIGFALGTAAHRHYGENVVDCMAESPTEIFVDSGAHLNGLVINVYDLR